MRTASDSIKSIIGMELNISELTRNGAAEANRTKNRIEKECANIERLHVFLSASQELIQAPSRRDVHRMFLTIPQPVPSDGCSAGSVPIWV